MHRTKQIKLQIISKSSSNNSCLTNRSTNPPSKEQQLVLLDSCQDLESSAEFQRQMQPKQIAEHLNVLKHFRLFQLQGSNPEIQNQSFNSEDERRLSTINQQDYSEQFTDSKRISNYMATCSERKQHTFGDIPGINIFSTISRNTDQGQTEDYPSLNAWSHRKNSDKKYEQASTFMSETKLTKKQSQAILEEHLPNFEQKIIILNKYSLDSQQNKFKKIGVETIQAQIQYTCKQQQLEKIYKILQSSGIQIIPKNKNAVKSRIVKVENICHSKIKNRGIKLFIKQKNRTKDQAR